eukprot:UC4_evm5s945
MSTINVRGYSYTLGSISSTPSSYSSTSSSQPQLNVTNRTPQVSSRIPSNPQPIPSCITSSLAVPSIPKLPVKQNEKKRKRSSAMKKKCRPVIIFSPLAPHDILHFDTAYEAANAIKSSYPNIRLALNGTQPLCKGYYVKYADQINSDPKLEKPLCKSIVGEGKRNKHQKGRSVILTNIKDKNDVLTFSNYLEAASFLKTHPSNISTACRGKREQINGYSVCYGSPIDTCQKSSFQGDIVILEKLDANGAKSDLSIFRSANSAAKTLGVTTRRLRYAIKKKKKIEDHIVRFATKEEVATSNISAAIGGPKSVIVINAENPHDKREYRSCSEAANAIGTTDGSIALVAKGALRQIKGFYVEYKDPSLRPQLKQSCTGNRCNVRNRSLVYKLKNLEKKTIHYITCAKQASAILNVSSEEVLNIKPGSPRTIQNYLVAVEEECAEPSATMKRRETCNGYDTILVNIQNPSDVRAFPSISSAAKFLKCSLSTFAAAVDEKHPSIGGYRITSVVKKRFKFMGKPVVATERTNEGNTEVVYDDIYKAAEVLQSNIHFIRNSLRAYTLQREYIFVSGCSFRFHSPSDEEHLKKSLLPEGPASETLEPNFSDYPDATVYPSISAAAEAICVSPILISNAAKGLVESVRGYKVVFFKSNMGTNLSSKPVLIFQIKTGYLYYTKDDLRKANLAALKMVEGLHDFRPKLVSLKKSNESRKKGKAILPATEQRISTAPLLPAQIEQSSEKESLNEESWKECGRFANTGFGSEKLHSSSTLSTTESIVDGIDLDFLVETTPKDFVPPILPPDEDSLYSNRIHGTCDSNKIVMNDKSENLSNMNIVVVLDVTNRPYYFKSIAAVAKMLVVNEKIVEMAISGEIEDIYGYRLMPLRKYEYQVKTKQRPSISLKQRNRDPESTNANTTEKGSTSDINLGRGLSRNILNNDHLENISTFTNEDEGEIIDPDNTERLNLLEIMSEPPTAFTS